MKDVTSGQLIIKSRYIYKQTGILKLVWLIDIIYSFFNKVCRNQLHSIHQMHLHIITKKLFVSLAVIYNLQGCKNSSKGYKKTEISRICALNKTSGTNFCQFPFVHSHSFFWQSSHLTFIMISNTFYWSQKNRLVLLGLTVEHVDQVRFFVLCKLPLEFFTNQVPYSTE